MHLGGSGPRLVELLHRRLHRLPFRRPRPRRQVRRQLDPFDDPPAPHLEHLDDRAGRPDLDAEGVAVAQAHRRHLLLAVPQRLYRRDRVAGLGRLLVPQTVGGLQHPPFQIGDQLLVPALQEELRMLHRLRVLLGGAQGIDARRDAPLDVVLETGPPPAAVDDLVARTDAEQLVRQRHRLARQGRGQERSRVGVSVAGHPARHEHPRKRLAGRELQVRIVLVVAEQNVEPWRPLLDEMGFEGQRLDQRVGDDDLQTGHLVEQRVGLGARAVGPQVAAHAGPQRTRPAHVERLAGGVEVQIDPRLLGQRRDPLLEITNGHGLNCGVRAVGEAPHRGAGAPTAS